MNSGSQRNFRTGLYFALFLVALFITVAVFLRLRDRNLPVFSSYTLFKNASGLQAGYKVWFNGVVVGQVEAVQIISPSAVKIVMSIDTTYRKFIHTDARAKVSSAGLMGDNLVSITQNFTRAPLINEGGFIDPIQPPDYSRVMKRAIRMGTTMSSLGTDVQHIMAQFTKGRGTIGQMMQGKTNISELKGSVQTAKKSIGRVKSSLKAFKK